MNVHFQNASDLVEIWDKKTRKKIRYVVQEILGVRVENGCRECLVDWGEGEPSWQSADKLRRDDDVRKMIKEFEKLHVEGERSNKRKKTNN